MREATSPSGRATAVAQSVGAGVAALVDVNVGRAPEEPVVDELDPHAARSDARQSVAATGAMRAVRLIPGA
jgi:hypothetical protein